MSEYNPLQTVKRRFFAMRNGIIADTLRRAGSPYRIIFGLNLPQIKEIAEMTGKDAGLAQLLWNNVSTRESMLMAPMIYPEEAMTQDVAQQWIDTAVCCEAVDILCHRLLRHLPFAWDLARANIESSVPLNRYAAIRLMWNLIATHAGCIRPLAEKEASLRSPLTYRAAADLVSEIDFLFEA